MSDRNLDKIHAEFTRQVELSNALGERAMIEIVQEYFQKHPQSRIEHLARRLERKWTGERK